MWRAKKWFSEHTQQGSNSIKRAAAIQLTSKYFSLFIGLGSQLVLARLLTPHDYGIIAVMMVFIAFFSMLSDFGMSGAIVQSRELSNEDINSIYAWSFRMAMVLGIGFVIISYPISIFYGDEIFKSLGGILALAVFFSTLNMVPEALLMKRKLFLLIGIRQVMVSVFCAMVAIIMAYLDAGVYALVISSVLNSFLNYLWNLYGSGLKLVFHVKKDSINKIRNFSLNVLGFQFLIYFSRNLDNMIIGKVFGSDSLGNYNRAYQLMVYPLGMFTNIIMSAFLPFFAEHQHEPSYIYEKFVHATRLLSLLGIFVSTFSFFCAEEIVLVLFGEQWEEAAHCFRFLSLAIWPQMVTATSGAIFQSINRTDLMLKRGVVALLTMLLCLSVGIFMGSVETVSKWIAVNYYIQFVTMLIFLIHCGFHESISKYLKKYDIDVLCVGCLSLVMYILMQFDFSDIFTSLCFKMVISLVAYIFLIVVLRQYKIFVFLFPKKYRSIMESKF